MAAETKGVDTKAFEGIPTMSAGDSFENVEPSSLSQAQATLAELASVFFPFDSITERKIDYERLRPATIRTYPSL